MRGFFFDLNTFGKRPCEKIRKEKNIFCLFGGTCSGAVSRSIMLRSSFIFSGRWNSLDYLKGRGKCAGAVHTRHTLGSRGRMKRYFKQHGFRDGLPSHVNSTSGQLGVRLGGGLFGARWQIPEQALMDKEMVDVVVYGHPSITNPFRDTLSRHPKLGDVVSGPTGSAWLAFPVGDVMWARKHHLLRDKGKEGENEREGKSTRKNNNSDKKDVDFGDNDQDQQHVVAQLRMKERNFVVDSASSFLLQAFAEGGLLKKQDMWAERRVILGGTHSSVILSAHKLMEAFNGGEKEQKSAADFATFVRNCLRDAHRFCVSPPSRVSTPAAAAAAMKQAPHNNAVLPEQFLRASSSFHRTVVDAVPNALKAILPPLHDLRAGSDAGTGTRGSTGNSSGNSTSSSSSTASINTLIKWYMRTSDPRAHFGGGGGHSSRRFSAVIVCPFAQPHPLWLAQLKRQGYSDTVSERDPARVLQQIATVVVDDSSRRVPLSEERKRAEEAVRYNNDGVSDDAKQAHDGNLWVGDEKPFVDAAHQLFPHLASRLARAEKSRIMKDPSEKFASRVGYAKSYLAPL